MSNSNNDLKEIASNDTRYETAFESERGFGNDRFDIYSFSFKQPKKIKKFQKIDDKYQSRIKNFKDMMDVGFEDNNRKNVQQDSIRNAISEIEMAGDAEYLYLYLDSEKHNTKIYVYSGKLNKGYCFILII